jgi:hypothetical protein
LAGGEVKRWARAGWLAPLVASLVVPGAAQAHRIAGVVPDLPTGATPSGPVFHALRASRLRYGGGPVLHTNRTHLVFWAPSGSGLGFPAGYEALMARFLADVAADSHRAGSVYGLSGQYRDHTGPAAYASTYGGEVTATDPLPANGCAEPPLTGPPWSRCVTDAQLEQELRHVVSADGLPRTFTDIYFLVLPDGLGSCTDSSSSTCALGGSATGYCGYHSETDDGLLYAVIPYNDVSGHCQSDNPEPNASPADPALSTLSHEHSEVITDPDTYSSWIDPSGEENGDLCITSFGPAVGGSGNRAWNEVIHGGHWYLQEEWSNEDDSCQPRDEADRLTWRIAGHPSAGKPVTFTARAGDPDGAITGYNWTFGDGGVSRRRATSHAYTRAGDYRVTVRAVDSAANWTTQSRTIRVAPAAAHEPRRGAATPR